MGDKEIAGTRLPGDARPRTRFPGISSRAYEHPADRAALVALRRLYGLEGFVKKFRGSFPDRVVRMEHLASAVRTSDRQFARIHCTVREAARILDFDRPPEVYVQQSHVVNAFTIGMNQPFVVLTTALVDLMDADELTFVIGHELGHALSGHSVYRTIAFYLVRAGALMTSLPLAGIGLQAVHAALGEWMRKSELSCDRAGLLVTQDRDACLRALMKLAGGSHLEEMSVEEFLRQAAEFERAEDIRDSLVKLLLTQDSSHPLAVVRVSELNRWAKGEDYRDILSASYPLRRDDGTATVRSEVRDTTNSYMETFKQSADPLITMARDFASSTADARDRALDAARRKLPGS
ncbi:M48 family metallopeptidase [Streptomyces sp. NPDC020858]|uniref:M48 family metallopeptidase n=1 Tax=Streptomyces sp. NPDC020858 TaxID=3365097 RepID=UPI0037AEC5F6